VSKWRLMFGLLSLLSFSCVARSEGCDVDDKTVLAMSASTGIEFIKTRFDASDYTCAIHAAQLRAGSLANIQGNEGVDARFGLRELAISISRDDSSPRSERLSLLKAVVPAVATNDSTETKEDLQADVRMLFSAAQAFQAQKDVASWLDILAVAIHLDRQLADPDRRIRSWEIQSNLVPDTTQTYQYVDRLATLAEETRGDKVLEGFRSSLAHIAYYNVSAWKQGDTRDAILERCTQLLRLTDALSDVKSCFGCVPEWHWQPIMQVGAAYMRLEMPKEGKAYIDRAFQMAQEIQNPDYRLGQYRFLLTELLVLHYDRDAILRLANEMKGLAESMDTPIAKETRASLPDTLRRWKIDQ